MVYLDERLPQHPKILRAGKLIGRDGSPLALAMFVIGVSYARAHTTDGFVPDAFVEGCSAFRSPGAIARVLADKRVGLWQRRPGGYQIHDYHDWNRNASEIKEQRAKWREKKAAQRRGGNGQMSRALSPGDICHVSQMSHRDSRARTRSHDPRTTDPLGDTSRGTGICTFRVYTARVRARFAEHEKPTTKTPTHRALCSMLHTELNDGATLADAIEGTKQRCAQQGFVYPDGDRLDAAIQAVARRRRIA